jgi:hypothetical protein
LEQRRGRRPSRATVGHGLHGLHMFIFHSSSSVLFVFSNMKDEKFHASYFHIFHIFQIFQILLIEIVCFF